ncbi:MAG: hypothetical protein LJE59_07895 [Chromatiaceae bacterium]|jgi:predicted small lipoprotein YifL|nr:hypothetical protein [Chromatiaceae bacterium]
MIQRLIAVCSALALLLTLGCGQKGRLYLPEKDSAPQHETVIEQAE